MLVTVMMYFKVLPESVRDVMKPLIESKPVLEQPILNSILKLLANDQIENGMKTNFFKPRGALPLQQFLFAFFGRSLWYGIVDFWQK
jgi:hypothetical protein